MRAIVIHKAKDLRVEDVESEALKAGQVKIKMATGGVCGSDLHYYNHGGFGPITLKEPMILGHEVSGFISELGEGVDDFSVGDLVAVSPSRPCYDCEYCHKGQHNHCLNMRFYGSAMPFPHIQGAFREEMVADASQCVVANGLSAGEAAMAEPLSVCLHATRRAGEMLGKNVLITGAGPIGSLCILAAKCAGAKQITVTDVSSAALEFAKSIGADNVINTMDAPQTLEAYAANKGSFDVLFECSGVEVALRSAIPTMRPKAIIMQLGLGGDMSLPMMQITAKELELRGSFRFHEEFEVAIELMRKGAIDVKPLITHTLSLEDAQSAFDIAADRNQFSVKAQIEFAKSA
ncbi:MAG: L-idonate 5-dehydrogenase [Nitratireductor sp.]